MEEQGAKDNENYVTDAQITTQKEEVISTQSQKFDEEVEREPID